MGLSSLTELTVGRGVLGLLLLTGLVYVNCLGGAFILDDETIYLDDPGMLRQTVTSAFSGNLPAFLPQERGYYFYRPVAILAHSWLLRLFGAQPFGLHFASVAVHAAAGVLVFLLALQVATMGVAWIVAALFLVHPLHVEAVAWMAAFPEVLAGALMLLSLYTLVRARRQAALEQGPDTYRVPGPALPEAGLLAISYLAASFAFLTKETALALPLMAALFVGRRSWPLFALAGGALLARFLALGWATAPLPQRTMAGHAHIAAAAALQYAQKLAWPWPLAPEYDLTHRPAAWLVFACACALAAGLAYRRPRARLSLLLIVIPLLPGLTVGVVQQPLREAQDRYAYLAVLGFVLLIGYAARHRAGRIAALALVALWSGLSVAAIQHWRDPEALWSHTLRVTPNSKNAVLGLGDWYFSTERFEEADRIYQEGLLLRPNDPEYLASRAAVRKVLERRR